ncbi:sugar phosphate nucleotidyltransferase [Halorientalis pallida]|uniref:sugar phosphate nucleotidyltransferase n=1 Tax=Halorientalis pallida TaxID=2479928 RepID=UPI003C6FAB73
MKAVIPTAGEGTRLYPHTHTKPKPMVRVAGKPILGHILSKLARTSVDSVVLVVGGRMQTQVIDYAEAAFGDRFELTFVEQETPEGLGHSIYQAEPVARGDDLLIALGDMLFQRGYREFLEAHASLETADASIGVKRVAEPQHYGIASVSDGRVTGLVEKPDDPESNLAISGVYIVEDSEGLFDALAHLVENDIRGAGNEYQLTDALARMVDQGATIRTFEVEDWYDCGRPETLLEANRVLLDDIDTDGAADATETVVREPVDIGDDVTIEGSVVGPYVSIDDGATVVDSILRDGIVGRDSTLRTVNLAESIIGDNSTVTGSTNHLNVGDNSTLDFS